MNANIAATKGVRFMAEVTDRKYFRAEEDARAYADRFLEMYGGAWNPYNGKADVYPPNDDRPYWLVMTSRRSSAD